MPTQVDYRQAAGVLITDAPVKRRILIAAVVLLACVSIAAVIVGHQWPFSRESVVQALQQQTGSAVEIGDFRQTYFPHPGCIAEGVSFRRGGNSGGPPLISIAKMAITGSYSGLLTHHIVEVRADGLHLSIAMQEQPAAASSSPIKIGSLRSGLTIGEIVADGTEIDFLADEKGKQPLIFKIPRLTLQDLADNKPFSFQTEVQLPLPPAEVEVAGKFGSWQTGNAGQTPLSGTFTVQNMDLGVFGGIAGTLAAKGKFDGVLQHVNVQGTTDTPKFVVTRGGHPLHLATQYQAVVNGLNGDVGLNPVTAHLGKTTIVSAGSIEGQADGPGKTVRLQMYSTSARIQDLLRLFVSENTPPMTGSIVFRSKVTIPPEDRPFIDKVRLQGDFGIAGGQYTNPETQKNIDVLSARAQGKADQVEDEDDKRGNDSYDPGRVLSNVKGHVALRDSIARLTDVSFDVPAASAQVSGTYKLKSEQIDLQGQMWLDTQLSKATTGVKSFLLKIVQPLTSAKKKKGSIVTLRIGGTYHNPTYTVLPTAKK